MGLLIMSSVGVVSAQKPLYIVNGEPREEIESIPPEIIEKLDVLPADEETISQYGPEAGNGVVIVTLKYDVKAEFINDSYQSFERYVIENVKWEESDPTAQIVLRLTIQSDGKATVESVLHSSDKRLLRRVLKVVESAPLWQPATKRGMPVEQPGVVLNITLPEGRKMPRERYVIIL